MSGAELLHIAEHSPFFLENEGVEVPEGFFDGIPVESILFPVPLHLVLRNHPTVRTLRDMLNTPATFFLKEKTHERIARFDLAPAIARTREMIRSMLLRLDDVQHPEERNRAGSDSAAGAPPPLVQNAPEPALWWQERPLNELLDIAKDAPFFFADLRHLFDSKGGVVLPVGVFDDIPLENIQCSARASHILVSCSSLRSVRDLLNEPVRNLCRLRNCGKKTIAELREKALAAIEQQYMNFRAAPQQPPNVPEPETQRIGAAAAQSPNVQESETQTTERSLDKLQAMAKHAPLFYDDVERPGSAPIPAGIFEDIHVNELTVSVRARHIIERIPSLRTVRDLLNEPGLNVLRLRNCGEKTVDELRHAALVAIERRQNALPLERVIGGIHSSAHSHLPPSMFDEQINVNIMLFCSARQSDLVLRYLGYKRARRQTLKEAGAAYGITRERARQIIWNVLRTRNIRSVFAPLIEYFCQRYSVISLDDLYADLVARGYWNKNNKTFFTALFTERKVFRHLLSHGGRIARDEAFVVNARFGAPRALYEAVAAAAEDALGAGAVKMPQDEFAAKILAHPALANLNGLFDIRALRFLQERTRAFFIHNRRCYSPMLHYIRYGDKTSVVIYWSMRFIGKPIHFKELTAFIQKNNRRYRHTSVDRIYYNLTSRPQFCLVAPGVYALAESGLPEYVFPIEQITALLKKRGPLPRQQIIELLQDTHGKNLLGASLRINRGKQLIIRGEMVHLNEQWKPKRRHHHSRLARRPRLRI